MTSALISFFNGKQTSKASHLFPLTSTTLPAAPSTSKDQRLQLGRHEENFFPLGLNTRAIIIPVIPKLLDYVLLFASNELTHNQERIFSCFIQFLLQSCAVFRLIMCVSVRPHAPAQRYVTS